MQKYHHLQIGTFHTNHCEDYLITTEIGKNKQLLAIMDGCTMGTDSYFISTLIGKLLRKIAKELNYLEFVQEGEQNLKDQLRNILFQLFEELKEIKNRLDLDRTELLSTLILGIIDSKMKEAEIIIIGDGLVYCNGKVYEYDQENKPDYLGYHLAKKFEEWYEQQEQRLSLKDCKDLSIASDGIFTFSPFSNEKIEPLSEEAIVAFLLLDRKYAESENMLLKKMLELERNYGLKPGDDLAILRFIF